MVFSKKTLTIILILIVLGAAAYYVFVIKGVGMKSEAGEGESEPEQQATETPLPVKVGEVVRGDLIIRLKSPGEAVTNMYVDMKAEVSGKVNRILVRESQRVKKGQVLLELDDREARLSLENSEATRLETLSRYILEQQFAGGVQAMTEPD